MISAHVKLCILLCLSIALVFADQKRVYRPQDYLEGVIVLNSDSFHRSLLQFYNIVIYFEEPKCKYCRQFLLTYALIAEEYRQKYMTHSEESLAQDEQLIHSYAQFAKMAYSPQTEHIFDKFGIDSVPALRIFSKGQLLPYIPSFLDYSDRSVHLLLEWIFRATTTIPKWADSFHDPQAIVIKCNSKFIESFNQMRRTQMDIAFYCSDDDHFVSRGNVGIIREHGEVVSLVKFEQKLELVSVRPQHQIDEIVRMQILKYKYNRIWKWSPSIIYSIFTLNQSAFVLLLNNETLSKQVNLAFMQVVHEWSNSTRPPIIFTTSDLSQNPPQATQLKRYLTGYAVTVNKMYMYPILAFIDGRKDIKTGIHKKYVFPLDITLSRQKLKAWIQSIFNQIIVTHLNKVPPLIQSKYQIKEYFSESAQAHGQLPINPIDFTRKCESINRSSFQTILSHDNPFFVLIIARHHTPSALINYQLKQWWNPNSNADQSERPILLKIQNYFNVHTFVLISDDLPLQLSARIDMIPAIIFIKHKEVKAISLVSDFQTCKQFILRYGAEQMPSHELQQLSNGNHHSGLHTLAHHQHRHQTKNENLI